MRFTSGIKLLAAAAFGAALVAPAAAQTIKIGFHAPLTGFAAADHPARAKVRDRNGYLHHVMVEPHEAASRMEEGDELLLVRREGQTFYGVALSERKLAPLN